jgi:glycosyltransferase involved in cell wall biosynthesis
MRVAFVLTQDKGGPVDLTVALTREISGRADGPEVVIVGPPPVSSAGDVGGVVHDVRIRSKLDLGGALRVEAALRRLGPDVVHAQDRRASLMVSTMARRWPHVATFHGVQDQAAGRFVEEGPLHGAPAGIGGGSRLVADAAVARLVGLTVTPSRAMEAFLVRELRVAPARVVVIHNGVAIPAAGPPPEQVASFVSVGSFSPCKQMVQLVDAFAVLARNRPGIRLRLVGDGDERALCEGRARSAGVADRVEFTGYRTDVPAQLEAADAFVLPSVNENLPLALLEAMAAGRPCIAARVGGIPEALDASCGVLVAPGNERELIAAMARLLDEPGLAARLGKAARQRAIEHFSISDCADAHIRLWNEMTLGVRR